MSEESSFILKEPGTDIRCYEGSQALRAAPLFYGWQETLIWSCLQGVMGKIYTDASENPVSAMALLGDFCFLAGEPKLSLLQWEAEQCGRDFIILVPRDDRWSGLIGDYYGKQAKRVVRYAMKKEPEAFRREKLLAAVAALPGGYTLEPLGEALFRRCQETDWCRDWVSQYRDYAMYRKYGLGAVILQNGDPVSGASSYSGYLGGIEIEIDTRADFRRKGLAYICGAKLILECLDRGWYPSWDAQNPWSAALAAKLGYHLDYEYTAYEVSRNERI